MVNDSTELTCLLLTWAGLSATILAIVGVIDHFVAKRAEPASGTGATTSAGVTTP